jgi:hydroxymethylglutaryl-CoA lyase
MTNLKYPTVRLVEEGMREGMQIESADITVANKVRLLDALSGTGLDTIVVGSFVSPKWTPQMKDIDQIVEGFAPRNGVTYTALALNDRGRERMSKYADRLTVPVEYPRTLVHLCDVFVRRNTNRSQADEIAELPIVISNAVRAGVTTAGIAINAAWGSNWLGRFEQEERIRLLGLQHSLWTDAGVVVDRVWIGDPMAWNTPNAMARQIDAIQQIWPDIDTVHLHLHDARGTALVSAYEAIRTLSPDKTLVLDTSIGGMGGCPYGGHGRMTRMIPTEDMVDLLNELGIAQPADLDSLIEVSYLAEEVVGHPLWGKVSKVGARPRGERLFAMDMPFIETPEQAQHFRFGPKAWEGAPSPWAHQIASPARAALHLEQDR